MKADVNLVLELALTAGRLLLENGAETYRAEQAAGYIFSGFIDGEINVFATVTIIVAGVYADDIHYTGTKQIRKREINLLNLEKINSISRRIWRGEMSAEEALCALREMAVEKKKRRFIIAPAAGLSSGLFALMIGGGGVEFCAAFFSCFVVHIIMLFSDSKTPFVMNFIAGFVPAMISFVISRLFGVGSIEIITLGAMLPFFPGVAMITAIRDTMNGDLVSGAARGSEAVFTAAGLAVGGVFIFFAA